MAESHSSSEHDNEYSASPNYSLFANQNFPQNTSVSIKLTEDNYLIWKQHVLSAVRGYGLEGFLTGEQIPPPRVITSTNSTQERVNPDYLNWNMQDQRLAYWIQSSLSESIMILVVGLSTSQEIWEAIETSFAHQSKAKVMQYRLQLQSIRKESLSMRAYLNKVKSCCDLLAAAGCKVSEGDQILHILAGLGADYNPAVVTITSKSEELTVREVSALLTSFETRLDSAVKNSSINTEGSIPTANFVQAENQRSNSNNNFRNDNNNNYRGDGGRSFNFRGRGGRSGGRGGRSGGKIICQLCQKPGHGADKCWHRFEQNFVPTPPQVRNPNLQGQGGFNRMNPIANVVQARNQNVIQHTASPQYAPSEYNVHASSSTSWYPDSGATNHISNDFGNLNSASEYNGGKLLHLGDGKGIEIKHVGNSVFKTNSNPLSKSLFINNLLHVPQISRNLLSVSQFAKDNGVFFEFHPTFCFVREQGTKEIILKGTLDHGLYHFFLHKPTSSTKTSRSDDLFSFHKSKCGVPATSSKSLDVPVCSASTLPSSKSVVVSLDLWHKRLGHCAFDTVKKALLHCNIPYDSIKSNSLCISCCVAKAHRLPYEASVTVCNNPLELVHSDLWGPSPILSRNGFKYYVTFIDHYSRFTWLFLLKSKSDVYSAFKQFKSLAENQLNVKIKTLQSDWGGEFQGLSTLLQEFGIAHRVSCPHTPQQNGLAERKHRHIIEMALAMLSQSGLIYKFWDDAVVTASYIINRIPTPLLQNISPLEKLLKTKPNYLEFRPFGCLCYPLLRPYNKHKLEPRSFPSTFLGYSNTHKGYKALLPSGKLIITRDIVFDELSFPHLSKSVTTNAQATSSHAFSPPLSTVPPQVFPSHPSQPASPCSRHAHVNSPTSQSPSPAEFIDAEFTDPPVLPADGNSSSPRNSPPAISASSGHHHSHNSSSSTQPIITQTTPTHSSSQLPTVDVSAKPSHQMITRGKAGIFKPKVFTISLDGVPRSALEALLIPIWKAAMLEEFLALLRNNTWILTKLPPGKNLIGNTWVFRLKKHADGSIARHKARLVAQGFSQEPGFDFGETFSPVVKPTTIRLILSIAISLGWSISHLDVNNAFLHGDLEEDIYMRQPIGFEQGDPSLVCKLNKALYGLKQASRSWFLTIQSVLLSLGFSQSKADTSLFFRISGKETVYLLIYVDDMLITGSSNIAVKDVISKLSHHFSLKDLGEVRHFLGVEVTHTTQGIHLCQTAYIKELLNKVQMQDCKPYPTPMLSNLKLSKDDGDPFMDGKLYRSTVGALQYATITRPEISFLC